MLRALYKLFLISKKRKEKKIVKWIIKIDKKVTNFDFNQSYNYNFSMSLMVTLVQSGNLIFKFSF